MVYLSWGLVVEGWQGGRWEVGRWRILPKLCGLRATQSALLLLKTAAPIQFLEPALLTSPAIPLVRLLLSTA